MLLCICGNEMGLCIHEVRIIRSRHSRETTGPLLGPITVSFPATYLPTPQTPRIEPVGPGSSISSPEAQIPTAASSHQPLISQPVQSDTRLSE